MGLQRDCDDAETSPSKTAGCEARAQRMPREKIRSSSVKPRRPDRAVYVPRARRVKENNSPEETKHTSPDNISPENQRGTSQSDRPKSPAPKDKSILGTPRKSIDKNFCNVYKPPHLRHQRSQPAPAEPPAPSEANDVPSGCEVPNSDSAITFSDDSFKDETENFYIGDYFANGQLGFYSPAYYEYAEKQNYVDAWANDTNDTDVTMAVHEADRNIIDKDYLYSKDKDEDREENELKRASQEINRSSKRLIKQSFYSDVLVISDPVEEEIKHEATVEAIKEAKEPEPKKPKAKLEPKLSLKREENDWDTLFDDDGECLDPSLLEELTATVGKVHITKAKNNYERYQTKGQTLCNGPLDETFAHVIEVYDFPTEFKTNDLLSVFSEYKDTGFEIKWVDDTHALIVFSSAKIAAEVLSAQRPMVRCRPLHAATLESRNKAKKCAEFLQPYRQRPETCTALARRLVSGALGVRLSTASQERAEERRLISIAREKKRQAALHKEAAWDGSLANQSLDT